MHPDPLGRLALGAHEGEIAGGTDAAAVRGRRFGKQSCQIVDAVEILPADGLFGERDTMVEFERQHDLEDQHGIEAEILVEARLRREGVHTGVVELVAQDRFDGAEDFVMRHHAASVRTAPNSPAP